MTKPSIICAVTNDLTNDRRMHRICQALYDVGYDVVLVGRNRQTSKSLTVKSYEQIRLRLKNEKGPRFYIEYNIGLYKYLLQSQPTIIYAVDTDTLLACTMAARKLQSKLIYDAHEYFTEVPELDGKYLKKWMWRLVEKRCVPQMDLCITVGDELNRLFSNIYNRSFITIRNVPYQRNISTSIDSRKIILYQGVLNKGRGLHQAIDAIQYIEDQSVELHIVGGGDIEEELINYAKKSPYNDRIVFHGWKTGLELHEITSSAWLGINLLEASSLNYYYSLANKFFDYMHSLVPSINMNFPEYENILSNVKVGITLSELSGAAIANKVNAITPSDYTFMESECKRAIEIYNWEIEREKLIKAVRAL